jgi:uroporphyrinogen-III synthase
VFTSANGVAAFAALGGVESFAALPVFAVGQATAAAAGAAGWRQVVSADGDAGDLAALIRREGTGLRLLAPNTRPRLLAPSAEQPAADLPALTGDAAALTPLPVYRAEPTRDAAPDDFDAVLVHSPRAARELAVRMSPDAAGRSTGGRIATGRIAVAISEAAAAPLTGPVFARIAIAPRPDEASLITTLKAALGKPPADV